MNIFTWLVAGAVTGGATSMFLGVQLRDELVINVIIGIVGAVAVGRTAVWLFSGPPPIDPGFSGVALFAGFVGAAVALLVFRFLQRPAAKPMARRSGSRRR